jgi:hypothetical protein
MDESGAAQYRKILEKYNTTEDIRIKFSMFIQSEQAPDEWIRDCEIIKLNDKYYSQINGVTIIGCPPYAIQVDQTNKTLVLSPFEHLPNILNLNLADELEKIENNFRIEQLSNNLNKLHINTGDFAISKIEIVYDSNSYEIKNYKAYMQDMTEFGEEKVIQSSIDCQYHFQTFSKTGIDSSLLNISNYIKVSDNSFKVVDAYSNYQVVNLIN